MRIEAPRAPAPGTYQRPYTFSTDWFSDRLSVWEKVLQPYKGKPNLRYLEVGAFEGRSLLWMLENVLTDPTSSVTAIDPLLGNQRGRLYANIEKSGQAGRVRLIVGYSQIELRKLPLDAYDIAYVDGSHTADDVLEDAVLIWRLVKPGGLLIFDDNIWVAFKRVEPILRGPKPALGVFYTFYGSHFDVVHNGYQLILRRRAR